MQIREENENCDNCENYDNEKSSMVVFKNFLAKKRTIVILLGIVFLSIFGCVIASFNDGKKSYDESISTAVEENMEEETTEEETTEEEKIPVMIEEDCDLLVCVPVENIALRERPGFGKDIIRDLEPGAYLKWYGEASVVEGIEFYKVIVRESGEEGYLAARFCVDVEFDYETKGQKLDIV